MALQSNNINPVLVTGAGGLLGSHLVSFLLGRGQKVTAMYHSAFDIIPHENLQQVQGDILDVMQLEELFSGVQQIYHCAGLVSFSAKDKQQLYKINAEGTANVVNAALTCSVQKLLHVSSVAALSREGDRITEKMNWLTPKNASVYGHSKFVGEMEVWRGMAEGLQAVIINPSIILGSGDWNKGSLKLFKTAWEEFPWYSMGENGFVAATDVAAVMQQLMESNITSERYIVNAGHLSYKELLTMMANGFQKKPPHRQVNLLMANLVRRAQQIKYLFTGVAPLITKETIRTATTVMKYDSSKLQTALPQFQYEPLAETVAQTCAYFKQNLNKQ